jgi:hypothetical protein
MRINYINTDPVDQALAEEMATSFGAVVISQYPKDAPGDGRPDALLYNLDEVPRQHRREVLERILHGQPACPRAVHGYDLSDAEALSLGLHGVAVSQRLEPGLIRLLCRAVHRRQSSIPPDDALGDETWTSLRR